MTYLILAVTGPYVGKSVYVSDYLVSPNQNTNENVYIYLYSQVMPLPVILRYTERTNNNLIDVTADYDWLPNLTSYDNIQYYPKLYKP